MAAAGSNIPPRRWKQALGRVLDTRGFTVEEWQRTPEHANYPVLIEAIRHILARLQLENTLTELLERDTLAEDWPAWLQQEYGLEVQGMGEVDPAAAAYGIRWCEIVLDRALPVDELIDNPPEPVVAWTRDVT